MMLSCDSATEYVETKMMDETNYNLLEYHSLCNISS